MHLNNKLTISNNKNLSNTQFVAIITMTVNNLNPIEKGQTMDAACADVLQETIYSVTQVIQKQGRESPAEKTFNFYRVHHMRKKNQNLWEMNKSTKKI